MVGILILLLWLIFCSHQVKDSVTPGKSQFKAYWALCRGSRYFPARCSQEGSYVRWGKDFTKHFWFIFCFKHLLCDSLRGGPSCSVPDAIKKVAFDSDLISLRCIFPQQILLAPCASVGNGISGWPYVGWQFHALVTVGIVLRRQPSCLNQHWQFIC